MIHIRCARLASRVVKNHWDRTVLQKISIDEIKDLKLSVGSGIETIQDALNSKKIKYLKNNLGLKLILIKKNNKIKIIKK